VFHDITKNSLTIKFSKLEINIVLTKNFNYVSKKCRPSVLTTDLDETLKSKGVITSCHK